jgi:uncharacterized membrane protein YccC
MTSTFDIDKFNKFIDSANEALACDATCQQNKTASDLEQKYLDAKTNLLSAPSQVEQAAQDFITFTKGTSGYQEYKEQQLEMKAEESAKTYSSKFDEEVNKVQNEIKTYETLLQNYANVVDLRNKYAKDTILLRNKFKTKSHEVITNDRKTYYEDQENENLQYYFYLLSTFYIFLLILYLILSFTYNSPISLMIRIAIFFCLVLYYFIGTFLLEKIVAVISKLVGFLPENVYTSV